MKLSSKRLRQIINEEVTTFRVREKTSVNEDDMDLFDPEPGDPDYKEPQSSEQAVLSALEQNAGVCLDSEEERSLVAAAVAQAVKQHRVTEGDDHSESDAAALAINMALDKIEKVHAELWGYKEIPRKYMETLDTEMEVINKNWTPMTGLSEADEGGEGVHDIMNLPEPEAAESTGNPKEDALRQIVATSSMGKVDGQKIDLFSASAVVQVLDALSPKNKEHYLQMPVAQMAELAFKLSK